MPKSQRKVESFFLNHFIPHKGNDHRPKALRHRSLFGYSVFLVFVKVLLITAQVFLPSASLYSSSITRANIVDLTNASRRAVGLSELKTNSLLNAAAQAKAEDMLLQQYFAHTSPAGKTPWTFIVGAGYSYIVAGENLAVHYTQAEDVTAGWMASPTHKANIMDARYDEVGVGIVHGTFEGFADSIIVVQMFGQPMVPPAVEDPVENTVVPVLVQDTASEIVNEPEVSQIPVNENEVVEEPKAEIVNLALLEDKVEIAVSAPEADEVSASLNEAREELVSNKNGLWTGTIDSTTLISDPDGADLYLHIEEDGDTSTEAAAWVAGSSDMRDVYYIDSGKKSTELFGIFKIAGLEDIVKQFYFLTMMLLGAALIITLLVKFEIQHHDMTAHVLVVIAVAGVLALL